MGFRDVVLYIMCSCACECIYRAKLKRIKFGNDIVLCHIEHRLFVGRLVLNLHSEGVAALTYYYLSTIYLCLL